MNIFQKVTLKNLKKNHTRTLVTIVGIILSATMFTAVTTSISSLKHYLIQSSIYDSGSWYAAGFGLTRENLEDIQSDSQIEQAVSMELLGYSELEDSINAYKPYLCVYGIQPDFTDMMPIHLTEGRMPKNSSEILLPLHLKTNGGIDYSLNDTLTLNLGTRRDNTGAVLSNQTAYIDAGSSESSNSSQNDSDLQNEDHSQNSSPFEQIVDTQPETYTVVGFYERPSFEDYSAPGYTALTVGKGDATHLYDVYLRTLSGKDAVSFTERISIQLSDTFWETNYSLLRLYSYSGEDRYNQVLFSLGAILIGIIMFGSISLIYNAFSISVSERTRQFGLLASIGATRKQLTGSVLFEALFLSCIGIPLGILFGMTGIGITFYFVKDMVASVFGLSGNANPEFVNILGPADQVTLALHPSLPALAIAVCISFVTVLISAWIPARRALKKSAIDAIRQTDDIAIRSKKIKTFWLTQKLFGFEGMIATKNYKRNRKKYRATVISLFLSVVLFISTSSWCAYLTKSMDTVMNDNGYDLSYRLSSDADYSADTLRAKLAEIKGITASTYAARIYMTCSLNTDDISQDYRNYQNLLAEQWETTYQEYDTTDFMFIINFLEDEAYRSYLKELKLPESTYYNPKAPVAVATSSFRQYNGNDGKYYTFPLLSQKGAVEAVGYFTRSMDGYDYNGSLLDETTGKTFSTFLSKDSDKELKIPREEACQAIPLSIGTVADNAPAFFSDENMYIQLFYPYSFIDDVFSSLEPDTDYYEIPGTPLSESISTELLFQCNDHAQADAAMTKLLYTYGLPTETLIDYAASVESERAMFTVINIFSFGFITLISLIAAANVFNTISTNINLRRREFAMLKSIGMTPKGFRRMMNFECLLYGFKGLLYGLPVSFLVTWLIYRAISGGLETQFFIPWYSIVIAVGSVFAVVFITMLYSMQKMKKENTIDALKNENL